LQVNPLIFPTEHENNENSAGSTPSAFYSRALWPQSLSFNLVFSFLIAFLYAIYLVGPRVLNPHNIDWLALDTATHYLGWAFYRQDVHLHWPITFTNRVGYPIGDSIAFFDLNPLLAVLLKPLSPLLPVPFQYLGIEILLQLTLQLFFALRLCSLLWNAQFGPVLFSSLFFLFAPIETARIAMSHGALSNQWLLLAALYLLVWANHVSPLPLGSFAARTTLLAAIAVAINPYLAFQVLFVLFTALAIFLWQRRLKPVYAGALAMGLLFASLLSAWFFGFIIPGGRGYTSGGYRGYTFNLLGPFDPGLFGSFFFRHRLPNTGPGQIEGYSYLGAGVLLLLFASLWFLVRARAKFRLDLRVFISLLLSCAILTALALSTNVSFGAKILIDLDPANRLTPYLSTFRASGRLFWVPYYVLLLALLLICRRLLNRRSATLLLAACLTVQLIDLIPLQRFTRHQLDQQSQPSSLKSAVWSRLGSKYRNLIVAPAWQCGFEQSPGGMNGFATFGFVALSQRMRINSYYTGRITGANYDYHCVQFPATFPNQPLASDSAYVLSTEFTEQALASGLGVCHLVDDFYLCTRTDDLKLGHGVVFRTRSQWTQSIFHGALHRNPSPSEWDSWKAALSHGASSEAKALAAIFTSDEFARTSQGYFANFVALHGRFPRYEEWKSWPPAPSLYASLKQRAAKNGYDANRALAYELYFLLLRREPDSGGLETWTKFLQTQPLATVIENLLNSSEFRGHQFVAAAS
jgi:hypothetical protein